MAAPVRPGGVATDRQEKTIGYMMSRFPKITETFILYEILELERLGLRVEVFPLMREREPVMHPEARAVVERAHYAGLFSREVLAAQLFWLRRRPGAYLSAWWRALRGNHGSGNFLVRVPFVVPIAAHAARRMQELGVEHVHAHWATHPTLAAYVIHLLTGVPYSLTAHSHDIYVERAMLEEKLRGASFVATISDYNVRMLRELYGDAIAEKTVVLHCGVDPQVFQPPAGDQPNDAWTIVCVASLQSHKGHPFLLDACAQLKAQGIPFRCLLIGEGEDRPAIEAQIERLGLGEQVRLLGRQPRDEVSRLVASADVVTLQSIMTPSGMSEGVPVALMEAMAAERPVVATALRAIPELVEDGVTGLLVRERDSAALAAALLRLYHDPALAARLAAAGRARVLAEYNLHRNAAALSTLLRRNWLTSVDEPETTGLALEVGD